MSAYATLARSPLLAVACGALLVLLAAGSAAAEDYYVDSERGDDAADGSRDAPWRSLRHAASRVGPGDTLHLRGVWYERVRFPAGREGARLRVVRWGDGPAEIRMPGNAVFDDALQGAWVALNGHTDLVGVTVLWEGGVEARLYHTRRYRLVGLSGERNTVRGCRLDGRLDWDTPVHPPSDWPDEPTEAWARRRVTWGVRCLGVERGSGHVVADNHITHCFQGIGVRGSVRSAHIVGNTIADLTANCFMLGPSESESVARTRWVLIERNRCSGSVVSDGIQTNSYDPDWVVRFGLVVRDNVFDHFGENCLDFKGAKDVLVEGNVCTRAHNDNDGWVDGEIGRKLGQGGGIIAGSGQRAGHIILRYNVIYNGNGGVAVRSDRPSPKGWYYYNNTVVGNTNHIYMPGSELNGDAPGVRGRSGAMKWAGWAFASVNNILAGQNDTLMFVRGGWVREAHVDHNLYFDSPNVGWLENAFGMAVEGPRRTLDAWRELLAAMRGIVGRDAASLWMPPQFRASSTRPLGAPEEEDFRLAATSPAIDAGRPLTEAAASGGGTRLPVLDSGFFFGGVGDGAVEGDLVIIGDQPPVRLVGVDHGANALLLQEPRSWMEGDPVTLPYEGEAPDIGACEYGGRTCWYQRREEPPSEMRPDGGAGTSDADAGGATSDGGGSNRDAGRDGAARADAHAPPPGGVAAPCGDPVRGGALWRDSSCLLPSGVRETLGMAWMPRQRTPAPSGLPSMRGATLASRRALPRMALPGTRPSLWGRPEARGEAGPVDAIRADAAPDRDVGSSDGGAEASADAASPEAGTVRNLVRDPRMERGTEFWMPGDYASAVVDMPSRTRTGSIRLLNDGTGDRATSMNHNIVQSRTPGVEGAHNA